MDRNSTILYNLSKVENLLIQVEGVSQLSIKIENTGKGWVVRDGGLDFLKPELLCLPKDVMEKMVKKGPKALRGFLEDLKTLGYEPEKDLTIKVGREANPP